MLGWSSIFRFKTLPEGTNWSPRICLYGDLGNANAQSLGYIQEELTRDDFDAILHVGKERLRLVLMHLKLQVFAFPVHSKIYFMFSLGDFAYNLASVSIQDFQQTRVI